MEGSWHISEEHVFEETLTYPSILPFWITECDTKPPYPLAYKFVRIIRYPDLFC